MNTNRTLIIGAAAAMTFCFNTSCTQTSTSEVSLPLVEVPVSITLPYFNTMWQNGKQGYEIMGHDPARWAAAVEAANRLPRQTTRIRDVEKLFGDAHLALINGGVCEKLTYFYSNHGNAKVPKGYMYALEFKFDAKQRLRGVEVMLHEPLPEPWGGGT